MDEAFTKALEGWHDFYLLVGPAAATLVGLLFVALSLNPDIMQKEEHRAIRVLARRSFVSFIYVLMIAGVLLVPRMPARNAALTLIFIGAFGLLHMLRELRGIAGGSGLSRLGEVVRRSLLLVAALIGLVVVGIFIWNGRFTALYWLTGVTLALLAAATQNAWDMLTVSRTGGQ